MKLRLLISYLKMSFSGLLRWAQCNHKSFYIGKWDAEESEGDAILRKIWTATTGFTDPTVWISSPSEQYGQRNQIRSKSEMQNKPDREPEIELSHLRYNMSLNEPPYLCASNIHAIQENLID